MKRHIKQWCSATSLALLLMVGTVYTKNVSAQAAESSAEAALDEKTQKTIGRLYDEAVSLYVKKRYREALARFLKIESLFPNYKQTLFYLKNIPATIEAEKNQQALDKQKKKELALTYKKAVRLYKRKLLDESLKTFYEIQEVSPGYAKSIAYIQKINKQKETDKKAANPSTEEGLRALYKKAVRLYRQKGYEEALVLFKKIEEQSPGYQKTKNYIKTIMTIIKKNIEARVKNTEEKRKRSMRDLLTTIEKDKK